MEDLTMDERRRQSEMRALAAERRMQQAAAEAQSDVTGSSGSESNVQAVDSLKWKPVPQETMCEALAVIFGKGNINKSVLSQWSSQGLEFCSGAPGMLHLLVQEHGGPCGVLAPVQAFVLKHLIFSSHFNGDLCATNSEDILRALKGALCETIWRAGDYKSACLFRARSGGGSQLKSALERVPGDSCAIDEIVPSCFGPDTFEMKSFRSRAGLLSELETLCANTTFSTDLGVLLVLLSMVLSRGVGALVADRDDSGQPLVTSPFGHASQEIVNLFLVGKAVSNVFDGNMEMGGDIQLKGIPSKAQVGFLTLLESLNYMKVGRFLKEPEYPIWVMGSESHYTVLYCLDKTVQEESKRVRREKEVRQSFDAHDKSGGGGFVDQESLQHVLMKVAAPDVVAQGLKQHDVVTWQDLWSAMCACEFPPDSGDGGEQEEKKSMDLYHVNGIAKPYTGEAGGAMKPTLKRVNATLTESLSENWARMADMAAASGAEGEDALPLFDESTKAPAQWCPLVDCIRTRWREAECHWEGDAPSMV